MTSVKVTGPFITGANRSPVSRREARFTGFPSTSEYIRDIAGRIARRLMVVDVYLDALVARDARVTTSSGGDGVGDDDSRFKNRSRLDKSTISEKFVEPQCAGDFHGPLKR